MTPEERVVAFLLRYAQQTGIGYALQDELAERGFRDAAGYTPAAERLLARLRLEEAKESLTKAQNELADAQREVYGKEVANE